MRSLLFLSLLALAFIANARQITPEEAQDIAQVFFNDSAIEQAHAPQAIRIRALNTTNAEGNAPYYVFNASNNRGFVIVSGDDRARSILGYSNAGNFNYEDIPPQLRNILSQYELQINTIKESEYAVCSQNFNSTQNKVLETAPYHQGYPFNLKTPLYNGMHYPTGCVATAMAIIMKYHNWPDQSVGNEFFNITTFQKETHDFNTAYDWGNILFDYSTTSSDINNNAVANLISQIATAVATFYGIKDGELFAAAYNHTVGVTFDDIFRYSGSSRWIKWKKEVKDPETEDKIVAGDYYTDDEWYDLIKNEIDENRPVFYTADDGETGHAFVIDGYDSNSLFHINWGWGGSSNGFFALTALLPDDEGSSAYKYSHEMYIGIKPENARPGQVSKFYFEDSETSGIYFDTDILKSKSGTRFVFKELHCRMNGEYELGVSLKDDNNQIVEVQPGTDFVSFDCPDIQSTWIVQAVYRENKGPWIEIPSPNESDHCSVIQQIPEVFFSLGDGFEAYIYPYGVIIEEVYNGTCLSMSPILNYKLYVPNLAKNGRIKLTINDVESYSSSEYLTELWFAPTFEMSQSTNEYITSELIVKPNKSYKIVIEEIPYSSLTEQTIIINNPTESLSTIIPKEQRNLIGKLSIKGEISFNNYNLISELFPNLYCLDLSDAVYYLSDNIQEPLYFDDNNKLLTNSLRELILPKNIQAITQSQISRMRRLETLYIPRSVNEIYGGAIDYCPFLKDVYIENPTPAKAVGFDIPIIRTYQLLTIHVPKGSKSLYENDPDWNKLYAKFVEYDVLGVDATSLDSAVVHSNIYNLQGVCVKGNATYSDLHSLAPGIYIFNGKKVVVKPTE